MKFSCIDRFHYWTPSRTQTLVAYDLTMNEQGAWECTCEGYFYKRTCAHVKGLHAFLTGTTPDAIDAKVAVKKSLAQGQDLAALFDNYFDPHPVTNRSRVAGSR